MDVCDDGLQLAQLCLGTVLDTPWQWQSEIAHRLLLTSRLGRRRGRLAFWRDLSISSFVRIRSWYLTACAFSLTLGSCGLQRWALRRR
eukprot:1331094-Pyramimonas_sp.AAC.1